VSRPNDREELLRMNFLGHWYGLETLDKTAGKAIGKGMDPDRLKQGILDALLGKWQNNIPSIQFDCKYLLNQISLLDLVTIEVRGRLRPGIAEGTTLYDTGSDWDEVGLVWGQEIGGILIPSSAEWLVTQIIKDFNTAKMTIRAERNI
jgi:hypothetical protein